MQATGHDFNAEPDVLTGMALDIFDSTYGTRTPISRYGAEAADMNRNFSGGLTHTVDFSFTPVVGDFDNSSEASHKLVAMVTGSDSFDAEGFGQVPFIVNRLVGVQIGSVTFNQPRVSLNVTKQSHASVSGNSPEAATAVFDIFDPDSESPPYTSYLEDHTYVIESLGPPDAPIAADAVVGANGNNVPTPGDCNGAGCRYTDCNCTARTDGNNTGCDEITASKSGNEWTFEWNPWSGVQDSTLYGVTYCQLKVHFVDNTVSASRTGDVSQEITEGLRTSTVTILLHANPGAAGLNYPPAVSLFYAAHVDLGPSNTANTTVTVTFEDAESTGRPSSELGYLHANCSAPSSSDCFVPFTALDDALAVTQSDVGTPAGQAGAWRNVYTFNGDNALPAGTGSQVRVYLRLEDAVDTSLVGYHLMTTLTRQAAGRRRRQAAGNTAVPRATAMTISIDENGQLSGEMIFPDGVVVRVDVDTADDTDRTGTAAPDDDRGDDFIHTGDGSSDRLLVIILASAVGSSCLLAMSLGYVVLRRTGTASISSMASPTRQPTTILVSEANKVVPV